MTRRKAVRVLLFERASLIGLGRNARCAIVDLSATGALATVAVRLPQPPLRLSFELGGEDFDLDVEVRRVAEGEHVAVSFVDPPSDRLHHAIAAEQRVAIAAGRANVRDRRGQFRTAPGRPG